MARLSHEARVVSVRGAVSGCSFRGGKVPTEVRRSRESLQTPEDGCCENGRLTEADRATESGERCPTGRERNNER